MHVAISFKHQKEKITGQSRMRQRQTSRAYVHSQSLRIPTERHFISRQYWQRFLKYRLQKKKVKVKTKYVKSLQV